MHIGEAMSFSLQALRQNPVRSMLTGLGMVIGTASVILVVTISLTSRNYILEQIEGVGSNMIYASYEVGTQASTAEVNADFIKMSDVVAVRQQLSGVITATTGIERTTTRPASTAKRNGCSSSVRTSTTRRCAILPCFPAGSSMRAMSTFGR